MKTPAIRLHRSLSVFTLVISNSQPLIFSLHRPFYDPCSGSFRPLPPVLPVLSPCTCFPMMHNNSLFSTPHCSFQPSELGSNAWFCEVFTLYCPFAPSTTFFHPLPPFFTLHLPFFKSTAHFTSLSTTQFFIPPIYNCLTPIAACFNPTGLFFGLTICLTAFSVHSCRPLQHCQ